MGHGGRMCDQALHSAQALGQGKIFHLRHQRAYGIVPARNLQRHHRAKPLLLPGRDLMPRVIG